MKALIVYIYQTNDQLRVKTETEQETIDRGWDWGSEIGQLESYSEAADELRNHLLGVIADLNWQKMIKRSEG